MLKSKRIFDTDLAIYQKEQPIISRQRIFTVKGILGSETLDEFVNYLNERGKNKPIYIRLEEIHFSDLIVLKVLENIIYHLCYTNNCKIYYFQKIELNILNSSYSNSILLDHNIYTREKKEDYRVINKKKYIESFETDNKIFNNEVSKGIRYIYKGDKLKSCNDLYYNLKYFLEEVNIKNEKFLNDIHDGVSEFIDNAVDHAESNTILEMVYIPVEHKENNDKYKHINLVVYCISKIKIYDKLKEIYEENKEKDYKRLLSNYKEIYNEKINGVSKENKLMWILFQNNISTRIEAKGDNDSGTGLTSFLNLLEYNTTDEGIAKNNYLISGNDVISLKECAVEKSCEALNQYKKSNYKFNGTCFCINLFIKEEENEI